MNEIIKNIENAQLKAEVPEFHVGDTGFRGNSNQETERRHPRDFHSKKELQRRWR